MDHIDAASSAASTPLDLSGSRRVFEIQDELRNFDSNVAPLLDHHQIEFDLQLSKRSLLRTRCPARVIQAALHILLENSLSWLADTPDAKILVTAWGDRRFCHIDFQDNGPGISDEDADNIFEPGWTGKQGGRGMGLSLARDVLEDHDARLQLKKRRRHTTFTISFHRRQLKNS